MSIAQTKFETKVWGRVQHLWNASASVSILEVESGFRCSVHEHEFRHNQFTLVSGVIDVVTYLRDGLRECRRVRLSKPGMSYTVPPKLIHSFEVVEKGSVVEVYWRVDGGDVDPLDIRRYVDGGWIGSLSSAD